jgi:protein gp37
MVDMGESTKIQWTDHTMNPVIGCSEAGPECAQCYAKDSTPARVARARGEELWGKRAPRPRTSEAYWKDPHKWNWAAANAGVRRRVFCGSLCDVLEDHRDWDQPRHDLFKLIYETRSLDWQLLTKRPENFFRHISRVRDMANRLDPGFTAWLDNWMEGKFRPENVWMGASCGNRLHGLPRLDDLRRIPARIRFISCEPLLEDLGRINLAGIHWVIVGGESGPRARPCNLAWIRSVLRQGKSAGAPVFVKQLGSNPAGEGGEIGEMKSPKGGDPSEWPEDLRLGSREFPPPTAPA